MIDAAIKYVVYSPSKKLFIGARRYSYIKGSYSNETKDLKYARLFSRTQDALYQLVGDYEVRTVQVVVLPKELKT